MTDAAVYLPLVLPAVVALTARPVAARLAPGLATWLLTVSSVLLAAASGAALGVLVLAGVLQVPQVAAVGHLSLRAFRDADPAASVPLAVVAGLALAAAAAAALRAAWRRGRALVAACHAAAGWPTGQLAVIEDETAAAFAVPGLTGRRGRVVVSTGMLAALDHGQRRALLAHEQAHLAGRHHLFLAAAHLAAAANPMLRPAERVVAFTVERWADEWAAEVTGDRRTTALAVGTAALAKARRPPSRTSSASPASTASSVPGAVLAVDGHAAGGTDGRAAGGTDGRAAGGTDGRAAGGTDGRAAGGTDGRAAPLAHAGPVPRRVAALLDPRPGLWPRRRLALAAAVAAIAVTSVMAVGEAAADLHNVVETAQAAVPGSGLAR